MMKIQNLGSKESVGVRFKEGTCAKLYLKLLFESNWYFCNITKSGWFWKRLSRKKIPNNHFLKSLQKQPYADVLQKLNFPIFTGIHLCWSLFLTGVSFQYCEIFPNSFFYRPPPLASVDLLFFLKNNVFKSTLFSISRNHSNTLLLINLQNTRNLSQVKHYNKGYLFWY